MMASQEEYARYQPLENCSSIAKEFVLNVNDSKSGTIAIVFNIVLNVVLMLTASLGNGIIIVAILRSQNLQTPSYLLVTSLAFTDLLMGLVFHPLQVTINIFNLQRNVQGVCRMMPFYFFSSAYLGFASLLMVTCIGIDRYLALTLRHRYNIIATKKRVRLLILMVWITSFFASFPPAVAIDRAFNAFYFFGTCLNSFFLLTTCIFYIKSFRALHLYTVQVQAQQPNPLAGNFNIVRYKKTLKTMLLVLVCFVFCSVPMIVIALTRVAVGYREDLIALNFVLFTLMSLNSSINPAIYLVRFGDIRSACHETLTRLVEMVN